MKRRELIAAARVMASTILCVAACALACEAQTRATARRQAPARQPAEAQSRAGGEARGEADEDFDLNIVERRITEPDFFASTEVSAGEAEARGLNLRVGVAVGAERIDVLLRNVRGHVRFRASLDALRRVLDARRAAPTADVSPPVVP